MPDKKAESPAAVQEDLECVRRALQGDRRARGDINAIADPLITQQTERFCKRYCYDQRFHYQCTLRRPWGSPPKDALLCEWGNGSYAWMLEDLCGDKNLSRYDGRGGARLKHYFFHVINSLPFYERWKDWRFGGSVHVPSYVKAISPLAAKVFLALRQHEAPASIAQRIGSSEDEIRTLAEKIIAELVERRRLHLLIPTKELSLTNWEGEQDDSGHQADIASDDPGWDELEQQQQLHQAWQKLTPVEQFVLEASYIEEQEANVILEALRKLDLAIAKGVSPRDTDRQQLYYFRRKSLAKLAKLTGLA